MSINPDIELLKHILDEAKLKAEQLKKTITEKAESNPATAANLF